MNLSIVIPTYNEKNSISDTLKRISEYLTNKNYEYEIIVVDDGSTDDTVNIVRHFSELNKNIKIIRNEINRGKGYTVKRGMMNAKGHYVIFSDADLSTPIEEVEKLLPYLKQGYDIAIGSRALKESDIQIHQPWYREYMGKFFNVIVRSLMLSKFHDTQCGFKCFRGDVARTLFAQQTINHFSFDVEVLFLAIRYNYTVKEIPIQWFNEPNTRVDAIKDSSKMLKDLLKIRYNAWIGKYN